MSCLSDENLAALISGSANAEQLATWKAHLASCDSCTLRLGKKQAGLDESPQAASAPTAGDANPRDPDATITVKPVGKPKLDAGAAHGPGDAIEMQYRLRAGGDHLGFFVC